MFEAHYFYPADAALVGGLENISEIQITGEGEGPQGSTLRTIPTLLTQPSFPLIRDSNANFHVGRSYTTKTSCRYTVCMFPELYSAKVPMVV